MCLSLVQEVTEPIHHFFFVNGTKGRWKQCCTHSQKEGDCVFKAMLELSSSPKSHDYQATSVGHWLAAYVLIMMWRVITIMELCECVKRRQQGHSFLCNAPHSEGQLKELRVTDLWKCHLKNVSWCPHNKKQKECMCVCLCVWEWGRAEWRLNVVEMYVCILFWLWVEVGSLYMRVCG